MDKTISENSKVGLAIPDLQGTGTRDRQEWFRYESPGEKPICPMVKTIQCGKEQSF